MEIENKYKDLIDIAKNYMNTISDNEHNINHMKDVVYYTKQLLEKLDINVNKEACIIAAYFHDVGRTKINEGHEKLSAEMLEKHMTDMNYPEEFISCCCRAIENHKWNMTPKTIEGFVLKDADKLAYIGTGRWISCTKNKQRLDALIDLLPKLRNEILYFDESRKIYDRDIVNIVKLLYDIVYKD